MPIRLVDTGLWDEDWFLALSGEYQHLIEFIYAKCDFIGIWKPNLTMFKKLTGFNITLEELLKQVNGDRERFLLLPNKRWFITGFIQFQYFNKKKSFYLILNNNLHRSIHNALQVNSISQGSVRGLQGVLKTSMDMDMDMDMDMVIDTNTKIIFNKKTKEFNNITKEDKKLWKESYPACDIDIELKRMVVWLDANPTKTKSNYKRFINNWLRNSQDKGGTKGVSNAKQSGSNANKGSDTTYPIGDKVE